MYIHIYIYMYIYIYIYISLSLSLSLPLFLSLRAGSVFLALSQTHRISSSTVAVQEAGPRLGIRCRLFGKLPEKQPPADSAV